MRADLITCYEGTPSTFRPAAGQVYRVTDYPTAAQRQGAFTTAVTDPVSGLSYTTIPANRIDPIAQQAQPALAYKKDVVREQYRFFLWSVPVNGRDADLCVERLFDNDLVIVGRRGNPWARAQSRASS